MCNEFEVACAQLTSFCFHFANNSVNKNSGKFYGFYFCGDENVRFYKTIFDSEYKQDNYFLIFYLFRKYWNIAKIIPMKDVVGIFNFAPNVKALEVYNGLRGSSFAETIKQISKGTGFSAQNIRVFNISALIEKDINNGPKPNDFTRNCSFFKVLFYLMNEDHLSYSFSDIRNKNCIINLLEKIKLTHIFEDIPSPSGVLSLNSINIEQEEDTDILNYESPFIRSTSFANGTIVFFIVNSPRVNILLKNKATIKIKRIKWKLLMSLPKLCLKYFDVKLIMLFYKDHVVGVTEDSVVARNNIYKLFFHDFAKIITSNNYDITYDQFVSFLNNFKIEKFLEYASKRTNFVNKSKMRLHPFLRLKEKTQFSIEDFINNETMNKDITKKYYDESNYQENLKRSFNESSDILKAKKPKKDSKSINSEQNNNVKERCFNCEGRGMGFTHGKLETDTINSEGDVSDQLQKTFNPNKCPNNTNVKPIPNFFAGFGNIFSRALTKSNRRSILKQKHKLSDEESLKNHIDNLKNEKGNHKRSAKFKNENQREKHSEKKAIVNYVVMNDINNSERDSNHSVFQNKQKSLVNNALNMQANSCVNTIKTDKTVREMKDVSKYFLVENEKRDAGVQVFTNERTGAKSEHTTYKNDNRKDSMIVDDNDNELIAISSDEEKDIMNYNMAGNAIVEMNKMLSKRSKISMLLESAENTHNSSVNPLGSSFTTKNSTNTKQSDEALFEVKDYDAKIININDFNKSKDIKDNAGKSEDIELKKVELLKNNKLENSKIKATINHNEFENKNSEKDLSVHEEANEDKVNTNKEFTQKDRCYKEVIRHEKLESKQNIDMNAYDSKFDSQSDIDINSKKSGSNSEINAFSSKDINIIADKLIKSREDTVVSDSAKNIQSLSLHLETSKKIKALPHCSFNLAFNKNNNESGKQSEETVPMMNDKLLINGRNKVVYELSDSYEPMQNKGNDYNSENIKISNKKGSNGNSCVQMKRIENDKVYESKKAKKSRMKLNKNNDSTNILIDSINIEKLETNRNYSNSEPIRIVGDEISSKDNKNKINGRKSSSYRNDKMDVLSIDDSVAFELDSGTGSEPTSEPTSDRKDVDDKNFQRTLKLKQKIEKPEDDYETEELFYEIDREEYSTGCKQFSKPKEKDYTDDRIRYYKSLVPEMNLRALMNGLKQTKIKSVINRADQVSDFFDYLDHGVLNNVHVLEDEIRKLEKIEELTLERGTKINDTSKWVAEYLKNGNKNITTVGAQGIFEVEQIISGSNSDLVESLTDLEIFNLLNRKIVLLSRNINIVNNERENQLWNTEQKLKDTISRIYFLKRQRLLEEQRRQESENFKQLTQIELEIQKKKMEIEKVMYQQKIARIYKKKQK